MIVAKWKPLILMTKGEWQIIIRQEKYCNEWKTENGIPHGKYEIKLNVLFYTTYSFPFFLPQIFLRVSHDFGTMEG